MRRMVSTPSRIDLNLNWRVNDSTLLLIGSDVVRQKMLNVLGVLIGEEYFEPTFGSNLPLRIFDPLNTRTAALLELDIIVALVTHMRGEIFIYHNMCKVVPYPEEEAHLVLLTYSDLTSSNTKPQAFVFPLIKPKG